MVYRKSGYSQYNGTINTVKSAPKPIVLADFKTLGVTYLNNTPAKSGQADWSDKIDKAGQVGLQTPDFRQAIIEAGLGNSSSTFDQIMNSENTKWKAGIASVKAGD